MSDVYAKLQALQITLPPLAAPAAAYVPYVQTGKLLFISGHLAKKEGKPWVGQLGKDMDTATGQQAARAAAIDLLGTLHVATGGDLNKVARIVKVMSLVNSAPTYTEQHLSLTVAASCWARYLALKKARMPAAPLAWRKFHWALVWKLN